MKEDEMKNIAEMITKIINEPKNMELRARTKGQVKELCGRFPLYPEID